MIGLAGLLGLMIAAGVVYVAAFAFDLSWGAAITSVLAYGVAALTIGKGVIVGILGSALDDPSD